MREFPFHVYSKWYPQEQVGAEGFTAIAALHAHVERLMGDPAITDILIVDVRDRLMQTCRGASWAFSAMLLPKYGEGGLRECEIYTPPASPEQDTAVINQKCSEAPLPPPVAA